MVERPRIYTTATAAAALGYHVETVRRAIREGRLACYRPGRAARISEEHLQAWLKASECPARDPQDQSSNGTEADGASSGGTMDLGAELRQERRMNQALEGSSRTSKPSLSVVPSS
jgi:excisionase family DNA binding protein